MRRPFRYVWVGLGALVVALAVLLAVSAALYSPQYIFRCIANGESKVSDYRVFPARVIAKSSRPYRYAAAPDLAIGQMEVAYTYRHSAQTDTLEHMLEANGTTSFILIRDDAVAYERYFNGYDWDSVCTSFSSVKSLDSLMVGMAIDDGFIRSEEQAISEYLPEFKDTPFVDITIRQLLMMRSRIRYEEGGAWFGDDAKTYYYPDLRSLALEHLKVDEGYTGKFHYNNYHPLLLGMILERSTGRSVAQYFQERIWDKVGAEHEASWSMDGEETGFEKMESGLNFLAIDYAKIGSMLLHRGQWNGNAVVSTQWLDRSLVAPQPLSAYDIDSPFLAGVEVGYQYMWYSIDDGKGGHDFFAAGKYGQYLYVSPAHQAVIVRCGKSAGSVDWWPEVLRQVAAAAQPGG